MGSAEVRMAWGAHSKVYACNGNAERRSMTATKTTTTKATQPFTVPPTTMNRSPLDVARGYISAGIPVFPCREKTEEEMDGATGDFVERAEKSPYTSNGLKGATATQRIIDIWFGDRHPNAMIGVPTGEPLGAWVLDIDVKELEDGSVIDGFIWLAETEKQHGPLPTSAAASTPRGGRHFYFKHVPGIRNRASFAEGADTRGDGGYVCAPGSVMADGRAYRWLEYEGAGVPDFPDAPAWLLELVLPREPAPEPEQRAPYVHVERDVAPYVNAAVEAEISSLASAPAGQRGHQLNSSAFSLGQLVASGALARSDAESELLTAARANGVLAKDGAKATNDRIKRGLDAGMKSPRQIPERDIEPVRQFDATRLIANTLAKKQAGAAEPLAETASAAPSAQTTPRTRQRFEKTWFDEIEEGKPKVFIIKGAFGEREFTTVSGLPGTGKSVIVTDAACHVATGREWHGHKVKQGLVVYVAAERKRLTERRMMAFRKHHGVHDVPLLVIGGRLDFTANLKDAKDLIAAIKEAEIETGQTCVWIIIDTLTRVFGAGDQNASKDMSRFVQSCDEILAETSAHVTAIHHSAWSGERGKGAIDLDGAVDASFMVKKAAGGKYKLVCDGTNDGEEGDIVNFRMDSVTLGHDEDGEPTTAPVVVATSGKDEAPHLSGLVSGVAGKVFAALNDAIRDHGVVPPGPAFPEGAVVVNETQWRDAFYAIQGDSNDTIQKQFKRGFGKLLESGKARQIGQWFFVA
jgi:KaiC/GvpD/RAD55 family RecA-like ATPase